MHFNGASMPRLAYRRARRFIRGLLLLLCACGVSLLHAGEAEKLTCAGLPNLYRVAPNLYRCAQPTAEGFAAAEKLGIKTVINLRAFHSDRSLVSTNLKVARIRSNAWWASAADAVSFLKLVSNTNNGPFLVHCQHGADRTGEMIAMYRIAVEGWSKDAAIKEMTGGGFGHHSIFRNLRAYLKRVDVAALRRSAGMAEVTAAAQPDARESAASNGTGSL
jgi:protein tyrosine/serine phosphatase